MTNLTGRRPFVKNVERVKPMLRQDARGRDCTLQIPGVCNHDPETTVACHLRLFGFGGMGVKPSDLLLIDCCASCHSVLDNRAKWADAGVGFDDVLRALMTTLENRQRAGLIEAK